MRNEPDILVVRRTVRERAVELGFTTLDQTRILTAASELARNTLVHGGGGTVTVETWARLDQRALGLTFQDRGPGIPNLDLAMTDGFTTKRGMGLGLGGSKRLVDEFEITSPPGGGTRVRVLKWM